MLMTTLGLFFGTYFLVTGFPCQNSNSLMLIIVLSPSSYHLQDLGISFGFFLLQHLLHLFFCHSFEVINFFVSSDSYSLNRKFKAFQLLSCIICIIKTCFSSNVYIIAYIILMCCVHSLKYNFSFSAYSA